MDGERRPIQWGGSEEDMPGEVYLLDSLSTMDTVLAAPAGRTFVPIGVLEDLAIANGMSLFQLCGSSVTGDVVLPEFLGPGTYDLFLARRGGKPFVYEKVGSIRTPLARNSILAVASP